MPRSRGLFVGVGLTGCAFALGACTSLLGDYSVGPSDSGTSNETDAAESGFDAGMDLDGTTDAVDSDANPADSGGNADSGAACVIGGMTYASGAVNPTDACQSCQPGKSTTGWTAIADGTICSGGAGTCSSGTCVQPLSCAPGGSGMSDCGTNKESCCISLRVTGGTSYRTYTNTGTGPTGEADPATVSDFRLDKYEVTVGRFRQFVKAWNNGSGWTPPAGAGKHTHLNGGQGLVNSGSPGTYEAGWNAADDGNVAPTDANLACDPAYADWTASPSTHESLPINCVNWFEAYAFCIWDGGFLPSEAEWEYAAAGGSQQREYPWGNADPGTGTQYAIFGCDYPNGSGNCTGVANMAPVGTPTSGTGLWGQVDLGGGVTEWNLDWGNGTYVDPCADCAYLTPTTAGRTNQNGSFADSTGNMMPTVNNPSYSTRRLFVTGFRCARTP